MSGKNHGHRLLTSRLKIMWHNLKEQWHEHKGAKGLHRLGFFEQILNPFFWATLWIKSGKEAKENRLNLAYRHEIERNQDLTKIKFILYSDNFSFAWFFRGDTEKLLLMYARELEKKPDKQKELFLLKNLLSLRNNLISLGTKAENNFAKAVINRDNKELHDEYLSAYSSALGDFKRSYELFRDFMLKNDNDLKKIFEDLENWRKQKKP